MGSTFSSAFENIHLEYRAVSSIFSSTFNTKHTLNIEPWVRHLALHTKNTNLEYRAVGSIFNSAFNTIHTLNIALLVHNSVLHSKTIQNFNIELWARHSALHSKIIILNIVLSDRYSTLYSTPYTLRISSYGFAFRICVRKYSS